MPVSLIGTCAAMYAFGFSINNMTLLALTLSVGFVVDDAIVMLENIVRHIEGGMRPFEAALKGAREIGFTIISITFSLIAVFIPVLLMGGMVGRVFREFAVTISVAIIISGFVSLTLTPMLCARVLRAHHEGEKQNIVLRAFEAMFKSWLRAYEWTLDKVIAYKAVMLAVTFATHRRHGLALHRHPEGLLPERGYRLHRRHHRGGDRHLVPGHGRACSARSPRSSARTTAVDYINSTVGVGGPNPTTNYGRIFIALKPRNEREPARGRDPALAAENRRRARHADVLPDRAEHQYRRAHHQGRVPVHAADRATPRRSIGIAPEMRDKIAKVEGLRDVDHRPLHQATRR